MDKKQVEKIATLARLHLSEKEKEKIPEQLTKILDYIGQLKELDTSYIPPMARVSDKERKMADDKVVEFKNPEKLTRIAPDFKYGFYRVKKIID